VGQWPGQQTKELCRQPDGQKFKPMSQGWTVTSAEKYFKFCCNVQSLYSSSNS
jgi:hypothetical protein